MNRSRLFRNRRWRRVSIVATELLLIGAFIVLASHQFSDVPDTAPYHDPVEWMVNRGITGGCAPGQYCPFSKVNRGQMAIFMNRLGKALTPKILWNGTGTGALDIDTSPVVCQTASITPTFPMQAVITGKVSIKGGGFMIFRMFTVYSTDGGSTWFNTDSGGWSRETLDINGDWATATYIGYRTLNIGTTYKFGIQIERESGGGTADATDHRCNIVVEVLNRNPSTPPLGPTPPNFRDGAPIE